MYVYFITTDSMTFEILKFIPSIFYEKSPYIGELWNLVTAYVTYFIAQRKKRKKEM